MAEKNSAQTNKQTDRHYENNGHLAVNQKSCYLHISLRCDTRCVNLRSITGSILPWADTMRHLGLYFARARYFKCPYSALLGAFYRAANSPGKIGSIASEKLVLQLIKGECMPML